MIYVDFTGNLGRDVETKQSKTSQRSYNEYSVAVNVGYGENAVTHWVTVREGCSGAQGAKMNIMKRGAKVQFHGTIGNISSYQKKDGSTGIDIVVNASSVELVSFAPKAEGTPRADSAPKPAAPATPESKPLVDQPLDEDGDMPF